MLHLIISALKCLCYASLPFRFFAEIEKRFSKTNNEVLMVMDIFNPNSVQFLKSNSPYLEKFLDHYKHFKITTMYLSSEFSSIQALLKEKEIINPNIITLTEIISKHPFAFIETLKILTIILTLPISTASNERFFSTLKRVENFLLIGAC